MASDSNLIRASFGLGQARAAADVPNTRAMQELYKSQADLAMKPFQTIMGVMGEMKKEQKAFDLAKSKQLQPLKNNFNKMYQSLYSEKEPLPQSFINAIEGQVTMLKDEFEAVNTIGKGDTRENERARNRIMGKFTKLKNSVVNFRGNLMKISGAADNIDDKNFSSLDIDPITYVSDINKWDQYVASGDMQYTFDEGVIALTIKNYTVGEDLVRSGDAVTFNLEQMADRLPTRPKALEAGIVANTNNAKQSGSDAGGKEGAEKSDYKFDIDIATSRYNADLDDEKELQFLMKNAVTGIGGNSFHEDLLVSDIINLETAKLLGFDETYFKGLDKDGDGFITTDDSPLTETEKQAWKNNTRTIVDAITNRYNPNYNFELSKELYIFHQVDKERQTNERAYDFAHKRANPELYKTSDDVPGNYKVGSNGFLINPALKNDEGRFGKQEYFGYRSNEAGDILYDDIAVSKAIDNEQSFVDAFGNKYEKVERRGKFVGYNIMGLKEGGTSVSFITFVNAEKARLWAVNKPGGALKSR